MLPLESTEASLISPAPAAGRGCVYFHATLPSLMIKIFSGADSPAYMNGCCANPFPGNSAGPYGASGARAAPAAAPPARPPRPGAVAGPVVGRVEGPVAGPVAAPPAKSSPGPTHNIINPAITLFSKRIVHLERHDRSTR